MNILCSVRSIYAQGNTFDQTTAIESTLLIERFNRLERCNPENLEAGRTFLQSFIKDVNTKYGTNLTLSEACKLVRENIHNFQLTSEFQNIVLATIESLESNPEQIKNYAII